MKYLLPLLLLSLLSTAALAGPLEDGVAASARMDFKTTLKLLRPLANRGNAEAQYNVGMVYKSEGDFRDLQDYMKTSKTQDRALLKQLSRENGDLGSAKRDYTEALKWFRKSAAQGDADAELEIGKIYEIGQVVSRNRAEADRWFAKSLSTWAPLAAKGDPDAQFKLSTLYFNGWGVEKDPARARELWRKAGDAGNADALYQLGVASYAGDGVRQDNAEAIKWLRKSADRGNMMAQMNLADFYGAGKIARQDNVKSYFWYSLYSRQMQRPVPARMEKKLTPAQIAAVRKRVEAWRPAGTPVARRCSARSPCND